jgi:hypothetical protein
MQILRSSPPRHFLHATLRTRMWLRRRRLIQTRAQPCASCRAHVTACNSYTALSIISGGGEKARKLLLLYCPGPAYCDPVERKPVTWQYLACAGPWLDRPLPGLAGPWPLPSGPGTLRQPTPPLTPPHPSHTMAIPDAVKAKVRGGCSDKIMGLSLAKLHRLMTLIGKEF